MKGVGEKLTPLRRWEHAQAVCVQVSILCVVGFRCGNHLPAPIRFQQCCVRDELIIVTGGKVRKRSQSREHAMTCVTLVAYP